MIALVFGGKSVEHDVSIVTAKQIYNALCGRYKVLFIYVDKLGGLNIYNNSQIDFEDFKNKNKKLKPAYLYSSCVFDASRHFGGGKKIDCAVFCCHGGDGENGTLVAQFLSCGIPTTCGSPLSLGVAMDKWQTKQILKSCGISIIKGINYNLGDNLDETLEKSEQLGYPLIVKPNNGGSSIGIAVAKNKAELGDAIRVALNFDSSVVIEKEIQNFTEYNVAAYIANDKIVVSSADEPIKQKEILSFADKYLSSQKGKKGMNNMHRKTELNLPEKLQEKLKTTTEKIYKSLGFWGVVRVDYIFDKLSKKLYANEINAIPGSLGYYFFSKNIVEQRLFLDQLIDTGIKQFNKRTVFNPQFATKLF